MAKANSISRSLIQISATQGWDATRIWDQEKGEYVGEVLTAWDHPREPFDRGLGEVPGGLPGADQAADSTGGPVMNEQITWNYPDVGRESKEEGKPKMTLSDPAAGDTTRDL